MFIGLITGIFALYPTRGYTLEASRGTNGGRVKSTIPFYFFVLKRKYRRKRKKFWRGHFSWADFSSEGICTSPKIVINLDGPMRVPL